MKRFLIILTLLALILSCFGCKTKPADSKAASDANASEKKQDDAVYPFADISADGITEVVMKLVEHSDSGCTKSYTDADAINKIIDFLNKAPKSDFEVDPEGGYVGHVTPYHIELKTSDGETKYSISIEDKTSEGYECGFSSDVSEKIERFYVESEYLKDLILHIATLDGREPSWEYTSVIYTALDKENCASVLLEYGDVTKELQGDAAAKYAWFISGTRYKQVSDGEWKQSTAEKFGATFYDADKKPILKAVLDGYVEADGKYQVVIYGADDTEGTKYVTLPKYFSNILDDAKNGFTSIIYN